MDYTTQNAEELAYIKANSAYSLPANPSQSGWSASQIREKLYLAPIYLLDLIQTYRNSSTSELESLEDAIEDIVDGTTIVGKATHDALGNEIADTYISGVAFGSVSRSSTTNGIELNCITPIDSSPITASVTLPSATSTYAGLLSASDKGRIDGMVTNIGSGNYSGSATSLSFVIQLYDDDHNIVAQYSQSLPEATTSHAGLLNSTDKATINNISTLISNAVARANLVSIIGEATTSLSGLLSATDKARLDALYALLGASADDDSVVNTINEVLAIFDQYPEGADLVSALSLKVNRSDIVDNLTTEDATKPLSAKQGKEITDLLALKVNVADVIYQPQLTFTDVTVDED